MKRLYGLGYSRLTDGQVAYFGRTAAVQRDGRSFIVLAEDDEQLQAIWANLNPGLTLNPAAVHDCGITHAGTLRALVGKTGNAKREGLPDVSQQEEHLLALERSLVSVIQEDATAPAELHQALLWVTNRLTAHLVAQGRARVDARSKEPTRSEDAPSSVS